MFDSTVSDERWHRSVCTPAIELGTFDDVRSTYQKSLSPWWSFLYAVIDADLALPRCLSLGLLDKFAPR